MTIENILLFVAILLFVSIIAGKTSYNLGVPTLIVFLLIGMLSGSEGLGGIYFDNPNIAQFIGVVALSFILFNGGLDTKWESVRPVMAQGIILSTLGVLLTAFLLGVIVYWLTDFSLLEGLLLGAIVSSTDAAAVFSILRSKNLHLKDNLKPTLELESGSNDPMAYFLTVSLTGLIGEGDKSFWSLAPIFFQQMTLGGLLGFLLGKGMHRLLNRISLDFEGLYPVLVISFVLFVFSITNLTGGNGFLAVYFAGMVLGNNSFIHKKSLMKFFDGQAWLWQIILFLTLGMLVFPSKVANVAAIGMMISLALIFVVRPIAVFLCLSFFKMKNRNRWFISWVGLRGAVPIVFAMYPLTAGLDKADTIFNIVFFISLSSVVFQGTTLPMVAKWLKLTDEIRLKKRSPQEIELSEEVKSELVEVIVPPKSPIIGNAIVDLNFPKAALIVLINRENGFIVPRGETKIEKGDKLLVMADSEEAIREVYDWLNVKA